MRTSTIVFFMFLAVLSKCFADDWVCPDPNGEFCEAYHAEYLAKQADKRLNQVYKTLLNEATKDEKDFTITAQRAWLKYFEAHCNAIVSKFQGSSGATTETSRHTCRTEFINNRIKELESYCESCDTPAAKPVVK